MDLHAHSEAITHNLDLLPLPAALLPAGGEPRLAMPALRHITVRFRGSAQLSFGTGPALPALRTLWLANMRLYVYPPAEGPGRFPALSGLPGLEFGVYHAQLLGTVGAAWLPLCTTKLRLLDVG